MEVAQYSGGSFSTVGDRFSTVQVVQYMQGDNISTVGDNISTVKGIQYCGGIPSVLWGVTAVHVGG